MSLAEVQQYRVLQPRSDNFKNPDSLRFGGGKGHFDFQDIQVLGFKPEALVQTRQASWRVYGTENLAIPNFPTGETAVSGLLALHEYNPDGNPMRSDRIVRADQMVLRISPQPIDRGEFDDDLSKITRLYAERPLWGFPSRVISNQNSPVYAAIAPLVAEIGVLGILALSSAPGEYILPSVASSYGLALVNTIGTFALQNSGEKHAQRQIPNLGKYFAGEDANHVLGQMSRDTTRVLVQRELLRKLQEGGSAIKPEEFLQLYRRISYPITLMSESRLKGITDFSSELPVDESKAFAKLLEATQIMDKRRRPEREIIELSEQLNRISLGY